MLLFSVTFVIRRMYYAISRSNVSEKLMKKTKWTAAGKISRVYRLRLHLYWSNRLKQYSLLLLLNYMQPQWSASLFCHLICHYMRHNGNWITALKTLFFGVLTKAIQRVKDGKRLLFESFYHDYFSEIERANHLDFNNYDTGKEEFVESLYDLESFFQTKYVLIALISAGHRKFFFKSAVRKSATEFQFS